MEARSSVAPAERNQAVQRNQAQVGGHHPEDADPPAPRTGGCRAAYPDGLSGHPAPCGIFVDGEGDRARPGAAGLVRMVGKIRRGEGHYACPAAAL